MKKLFTILLVIISVNVFGQIQPQPSGTLIPLSTNQAYFRASDSTYYFYNGVNYLWNYFLNKRQADKLYQPINTPSPLAFSLSAGYGLSGGSFNGSAAIVFTADTASATGVVSKGRLATNLTGYVPIVRTITINGATRGISTNPVFNVGGVMSAGLSMPSAFTVIGSPITSSGTFAVTGAGTTSQYIRGDGSLATTPTGTVTSVAKGFGLIADGTITTTGTVAVDSAVIRTVANSRTLAQTQAALDLKESLINKNANNGYAGLDAGGKVGFAQLPSSLFIYKGTWNVSTNTPTLSDATGISGWVYIVSVGGTVNTGSGNITYSEGDYALYNGTIWQRSVGTNNVASVNGQQGVVSLTTTDIPEGTNLYFTGTRARGELSAGTGITYDSGTGVITNSSPSSGGTVTSVSGTSPISVATGTTTPVISMTAASAANEGYVTTGTQTFAGAKTFSLDLSVNGLKVGRGAGNISSNTVIGNNAAGSNLNTAGNNLFLGESAGFSNTTGASNSFIGRASGGSNTTGYHNVFVGEAAGLINTTGHSNSFIGRSAGSGVTTGSGNTIIGNNAAGSAALTNNIILANGTGGAGAIKAQNNGTDWTFTGAVGLSGALTGTSATFQVGTNNTSALIVNGSTAIKSRIGTGFGATFLQNNNHYNGSAYVFDDNTAPSSLISLSGGGFSFQSGAAGINPSTKVSIDVTGAITGTSATFSGGDVTVGSSSNLIAIKSSTATGFSDVSYLRLINNAAATLNQRIDLIFRWEDGTYNGIGGISMIRQSATARSGSLFMAGINSSGDPGNGITIMGNGNVGIGTTSPVEKFQVDGNILIGEGFSTNQYYSQLSLTKTGNGILRINVARAGVGSGTLSLMDSGGNVGIGTTSPTGTYGQLTVAGGVSILNDSNAKLEIGRYSVGTPNSYIKLAANSESLRITNNTDAADIFTLTNAGNVGIGTSSPATSGLLDLTSTTGALILTRMTTTERNAMTAVNGMLIYNTTTATIQGYQGGAWTNL